MGAGSLSGIPSREDLGTAGWGKLGGGFQMRGISDEISQEQRGEIHHRGAHVVDEPTPRGVSLVESQYLLVTTGRCDRSWDGSQLEMTEGAFNSRLMGDGSNDPQCVSVAKGTRGHIQSKYAAQQPGSIPIRGSHLRFLAVHTLLARCRNDYIAKLAA